MTMRITGMSSGLDVDSIVTDTLKPYMTKIDTAKQQKQILEWKQEQYQDIMKKADTFYTKYLTTTGSSSLFKMSAYNETKFTSDNSAVSVSGSSDANIQNYTVSNVVKATKAYATISNDDLNNINTLSINNTSIISDSDKDLDLTGLSDSEIADKLNEALQEKGFNVSARYSDFANNGAGGLIIENKEAGTETLSVKINGTDKEMAKPGNGLYATISDGSNTIYIKDGEQYKKVADPDDDSKFKLEIVNNSDIKINQNNVTIDGTTFKFNSSTTELDSTKDTGVVDNSATNTVNITGSQDVSKLKDTIVSFVKDYNDLIGDINTKLWEEYDTDYQPLTDDQMDAMSDKQIENWQTKAQTGLLRKDEDLRNLSDSLKDAMNTFMGGSGLSLERIGFKAVNDYKEDNGKFDIDEDKLKTALESNFDDIKDLFMKNYTSDDTSNAGIIPKVQKIMYNNFEKYDSVFNKKAAKSGVYAVTNDMYKSILEKKNLIEDLNDDYTDRQNDLYTKYSKLETAMAEAQSQQSSMSAWFGTSS
ncbi:flagellar filament capping protein FliD [Clostridium sp. BJN0001]|uniref:flagellar filament capping protein FliD n=1 Tax=Clostridium sp. BJN0001 TaxID=2930219 RepID=UPI001FCFFAAC|nr:flagellar filament capping protein FliD [Clostridium sp. BJN0001]